MTSIDLDNESWLLQVGAMMDNTEKLLVHLRLTDIVVLTRETARIIGINPPTTSQLIDTIESAARAGLVERHSTEDSGPVLLDEESHEGHAAGVRLTPRGALRAPVF